MSHATYWSIFIAFLTLQLRQTSAASCAPRDAVLVLQSTGRKNEFAKIQQLAEEVVSTFNVGTDNLSDQFALVSYDRDVDDVLSFNKFNDMSKLQETIENLRSSNKNEANIVDALDRAFELALQDGRKDTPKFIILVSDGQLQLSRKDRPKACSGATGLEQYKACLSLMIEAHAKLNIQLFRVPVPDRSGGGDDILASLSDLYVSLSNDKSADNASCSSLVPSSSTAAPTQSFLDVNTDCFLLDTKYVKTKKIKSNDGSNLSSSRKPSRRRNQRKGRSRGLTTIDLAAQCQQKCQITDSCEYWTYEGVEKECNLYQIARKSVPTPTKWSFVSGPRFCTPNPTLSPTFDPTSSPTLDPTLSPTLDPTSAPTLVPTASPTLSPSTAPSLSPTLDPTSAPTLGPTASPTLDPTVAPSLSPTLDPTSAPTLDPTTAPTLSPTTAPSLSPTLGPTASPTLDPTTAPSLSPTLDPTAAPTLDPTATPTLS